MNVIIEETTVSFKSFLILAALLSPCVRVIISVILLQYLSQCNTGKYQERLDFVVSKSTVVE